MFKKNSDFFGCNEERKNESFFKVVQTTDLSSENMRALPHDFVKNLSDNALSGNMKVNKAQWGRSWEMKISKNPRFYYMEKPGWEKFVRESGLANNEFLTFTHKGSLQFTVNIFNHDGKEILQPPPQSSAFLASASRIKTKQRESTYNNVKTEEVLSSDLSYLGSRTPATTGGGKHKRKLSFGNSQNQKSAKPVNVERNCAGASSSSKAEFNIVIRKSHLTAGFLPISKSVSKDHMPKKNTKFVIHHADDKDKSWQVTYLLNGTQSSIFSAGWKRLAQQYPLALYDICKFTFIKPDELILQVSKPTHS